MSHLYVAVLAVIVVTLLSVAIYRTFQVKTKADYLVAGRSLPAIVLVLTLLSSWIGGGSLFGGAANAYQNGFAALWQPAGGWLALLLIYFIAPRARKFAQFTLPDLLEVRYNQTARVLGTIAILFAYVGIASYQFTGGGNVLHLIFPETVTPVMGTYIIAAFVIFTTALAGMSSVAYMDTVIGSMVDHHLPHCRAHALLQSGRLDRPAPGASAGVFPVAGQLPDDSQSCASAGGIRRHPRAGIPGAHHAAAVGQPGDVSEVFLGQDAAGRAPLGGGLVFWRNPARDADRLHRRFWHGSLPLLRRANQTTARDHPLHGAPRPACPDGCFAAGRGLCPGDVSGFQLPFSPATNLVNDVFSRYISPGASNKRVLIVSRLAVVLLGCWALYQSLHAESVIHTMLWAYTVYAASLTPVVLAAFFSKRVTAWGAVAAIGAGTLVTLVWDIQAVKDLFPRILADRDAIFLALPVAVLAMIVVSFFTPKPAPEQLAQFAD